MVEGQLEFERKLLEVLSPEYLEPLIKFLNILRKLDELGILDSLSNLLSGEVIEDLAGFAINTGIIRLLNNYEGLMTLLVGFSEASLDAARDSATDDKPVISTLTELLSDEDARRGLNFLLLTAKYLGRRLREGAVGKA